MENKCLYNKKKKYPQTTVNSRQNSGEKQITRIMSLKHSKIVNGTNNPSSAGGNIKQNIKPSIVKSNTNTNSNNNSNNNILDLEANKHHYLIPNVNINIEGKIIIIIYIYTQQLMNMIILKKSLIQQKIIINIQKIL